MGRDCADISHPSSQNVAKEAKEEPPKRKLNSNAAEGADFEDGDDGDTEGRTAKKRNSTFCFVTGLGARLEDYCVNLSGSGVCGVQWIDRYLVGLTSWTEKCIFLDALTNVAQDANHPALEDFYHVCFREPLLFHVNSMVEVAMLVLYQFFYIFLKRRDNAKCWMIVDLPPGVGKTYEVERLCSVVNEYYVHVKQDQPALERVLITTPTAKTKNAYKRARTLHSQFGLPIKRGRVDFNTFRQSVLTALGKPSRLRRFART